MFDALQSFKPFSGEEFCQAMRYERFSTVQLAAHEFT